VPVTLAHPALAIPLRRLLGGAGVLSALVIGSVIPDIHYFLPLPLSRATTHSLPGAVLVCVPLGLLAYVAFHLVLARPLIALLPASWQARLVHHARAQLPAAPWPAVVLSIAAGTLSHLAWDFATHGNEGLWAMFPWLDTRLAVVSAYPIYGQTVIRMASNVIGIGFLAWRIARWRRSTPAAPLAKPLLHPAIRTAVLVALVVTTLSVAVAELQLPRRTTLRAVQRILVRSGVPSLSWLGMSVLLYCGAWHALRALDRSARS